MAEIESTKIVDGLGFGDGGISHDERVSLLRNPEALKSVEALINSEEILVDVDKDTEGKVLTDDGCGDGRGVGRIFQGNVEKQKSLNRAKVFGGGIVQTAAAMIANGEARGTALQPLMKASLNKLKANFIDFGAHSDTHAKGESCGCGAIDKFDISVQKAIQYKEQITGTIQALGVDTSQLDEVYGEYETYATGLAGQQYSGREVLQDIMDSGKVVKELTDDHREMFVILNDVEGKTIDQSKVRQVSGDEIQAFGVDIWRMQQLAHEAYDSDEERSKAFLGMLIQTLGTAATLTAGDLPVYRVKSKQFQPVDA